MDLQNRRWMYVMGAALFCSIAVAGLPRIPAFLYVVLFLGAVGTTLWMLKKAWTWQKTYAGWSWIFFLSSLLVILLITDSLTHLTWL